ncbi:hypothetical protein Poly41_71710 [Novipirellula artificiosorum]|uniref:Uncharacterized protein n=1 Tax=Novipirellula artificiosorum TaxID=2528016 RepID=A0A5C6CA12_9BACT|nr:hypothetical protein Poly41_71710 [Novipirellula artificiosorum]
MPPSEMKPTRLATVKFCCVITNAITPPMNAVGKALRICNTIRTDGNNSISTKNIPTTETAAKIMIRRVARCWLSN